MAIDLSVEAADTYFGPRNHIKTELWSAYSDDQRAAAIASAARLITATIGSDVSQETQDDQYRPQDAVFEQALYMLQNSFAIPNAEMTAPHFTAVVPENGKLDSRIGTTFELASEVAGLLKRPQRLIYAVRG